MCTRRYASAYAQGAREAGVATKAAAARIICAPRSCLTLIAPCDNGGSSLIDPYHTRRPR